MTTNSWLMRCQDLFLLNKSDFNEAKNEGLYIIGQQQRSSRPRAYIVEKQGGVMS